MKNYNIPYFALLLAGIGIFSTMEGMGGRTEACRIHALKFDSRLPETCNGVQCRARKTCQGIQCSAGGECGGDQCRATICHGGQCFGVKSCDGSQCQVLGPCTAYSVCPTGTTFDATSGKCVGQPTCPAGATFDATSGKCATKKIDCPLGFKLVVTKNDKSDNVATCEPLPDPS